MDQDQNNSAKLEFNQLMANYPASLQAKDISEILGISLSAAYVLLKDPEFPAKKIRGVRRIIIPKIAFVDWYMNL